MAEELQQKMQEFERNRIQLLNIGAQKQQLQFQSGGLGKTLDELKKTKEEKVYKAVGNIMILSNAKEVKKEVEDQKESVDLRIKSFQKQEDALVDKLNKLKADLEKEQKKATGKTEEKKEEKK